MFLYGQQTAGGAQAPSMWPSLIMMGAIFVIFYFLIIRPQRKRQKQHLEMVQSLKGGERVITAGGVFGTVVRVMDDRVEISVDKNTRLQVLKSSISTVIDSTGSDAAEK